MSKMNMHWEGRALVKDETEEPRGNMDVRNLAMVTQIAVLNWAVFMHDDSTGWVFTTDGFDTEEEARRYAEVRAKLDRSGG